MSCERDLMEEKVPNTASADTASSPASPVREDADGGGRRKRVAHLVVDAGAFIRQENLRSMADNLYTVDGVIREVRDSAAREALERMEATGVELQRRVPTDSSMRAVVAQARATGDLGGLSSVDLQVLALAHMVALEHGALRTEASGSPLAAPDDPDAKTTANASHPSTSDTPARAESAPKAANKAPWAQQVQQNVEKAAKEATDSATDGAFPSLAAVKPTGPEPSVASEPARTSSSPAEAASASSPSRPTVSFAPSPSSSPSAEPTTATKPDATTTEATTTTTEATSSTGRAAHVEAWAKPTEEPTGVDPDGWVTPSNLSDMAREGSGWGAPKPKRGNRKRRTKPAGLHSAAASQEEEKPLAACVTTDFAMQNVLLHLGVPVLSLQGRAVDRLKRWVLKCDTCLEVTPETTRLFCPSCGHNTLRRLATSVKSDGTVIYHYSRHARVNKRGQTYSIPAPKGGRDGGLLLREDQLLTGAWAQKARATQRTKLNSMFGEVATELLPDKGVERRTVDTAGSHPNLQVRGARGIVVGLSGNPNAKKGRERRGQKKKNKQKR